MSETHNHYHLFPKGDDLSKILVAAVIITALIMQPLETIFGVSICVALIVVYFAML